MAETTDTVKIVLRAVDQATDALQQTRRALDGLAGGQERFNGAAVDGDRQTRRLGRAIENLTSGHGLAATAIARMQGVLVGIPFGIVIGAVSALTESLIKQAIKWFDLETAASRATRTLNTFGQTAAQAVAPAIMANQTRIEEINKQLGNINARTAEVGAAIARRLTAERDLLISQQKLLQGVAAREQATIAQAKANDELTLTLIRLRDGEIAYLEAIERRQLAAGVSQELLDRNQALREEIALRQELQADAIAISDDPQFSEDTFARFQQHEAMLTATVQAGVRDRVTAREWEEAQELAVIARAMTARQQALFMEMALLQSQNTMLGTLAGLSASRSKALFIIGKAAAVAGSLVSAHLAAAQAAAAASVFGPQAAMAAGALVLKWGYANAALAAAVQLATGGFSGGGGGPSVGGAGSAPAPATAREIGPSASSQPLPQTINIYIDGNLVDLSQLSRELRPYQIQLTKDTI